MYCCENIKHHVDIKNKNNSNIYLSIAFSVCVENSPNMFWTRSCRRWLFTCYKLFPYWITLNNSWLAALELEHCRANPSNFKRTSISLFDFVPLLVSFFFLSFIPLLFISILCPENKLYYFNHYSKIETTRSGCSLFNNEFIKGHVFFFFFIFLRLIPQKEIKKFYFPIFPYDPFTLLVFLYLFLRGRKKKKKK